MSKTELGSNSPERTSEEMTRAAVEMNPGVRALLMNSNEAEQEAIVRTYEFLAGLAREDGEEMPQIQAELISDVDAHLSKKPDRPKQWRKGLKKSDPRRAFLKTIRKSERYKAILLARTAEEQTVKSAH